MPSLRIALVGDYSGEVVAHRAIDETMTLCGREQPGVAAEWVHTAHLRKGDESRLAMFQGIWCVPASPYANTEGALWAVQFARERNMPFLSTCGGFQHALIEVARNVLGNQNAAHEELDPNAMSPIVSRLACSLVERSEQIVPVPGGRFAKWYGSPREEDFHCSFGLNPEHEPALASAGFSVAARSASGAVRAMEWQHADFFVGTLFQPERAVLRGEIHPLIRAFVAATSGCGE